MSNIPVFNINHILFYVDGLDNSISDIVNIVFLLAKYHIHCCKWRDSLPCFEHFMNKCKVFYSSLRLLKKFGAPKISSDMSKFLVFYLLFFIFALHVLWIPLRFYTECYCIWFILCCFLYELLYSILFNKKKKKKKKGYIRWTLRSLPYPKIHSAPVEKGLLFKQNSRRWFCGEQIHSLM